MHLSCIWKICISLFICSISIAQEDSSTVCTYNTYRDNPILYGDIGFNSAPFSIKYNFGNGIDKLKYRHNFKTMLGIGYAHRWFSLRLGLAVIGNVRPQSRYGKANYFDLNGSFEIGKTYNEIGLRVYNGYVIKDAYLWDTTYSKLVPNDVNQSIQASNFYIKSSYFFNKEFKSKPFEGIKGCYNKNVFSSYLDFRLDAFGISNNINRLIPNQLEDSLINITSSKTISGFELGVIPGIGYVGISNKWQYGIIAGIGPALQIKTYVAENISRSFLTLIPKYELDFRLSYQQPTYFYTFSLSSDYKMINFNELKFRQNYYMIRFTIGHRFKARPKKVKQKKNL